jgi:hypothetical protein
MRLKCPKDNIHMTIFQIKRKTKTSHKTEKTIFNYIKNNT